MSAPAAIFIMAGALSLISLVLRRRRLLPYLIASAGSALIGLLILYVPIDEALSLGGASVKIESAWQVLGRSVLINERNRAAVSLLFLSGGLFFACSWIARPGRSFAPVGMLILVLLTGALAIEPFLFAAVFLELAAMAAILVLIPPGSAIKPRVLQLLVLYTLAMIAILFTGWLLENVGITSVTPELAQRVKLLLGFGFSILMLVPPFHFWLPSAADDVNPLALAFVATVLQGVGFFMLLRFLDSFAWLRADTEVMGAISVAGIGMLLFGAVGALAQRSFKKMAAYALLADFGAPLVAVGSNLVAGFQVGLLLTGVRVIGLALWAVGTAMMEREAGQLDEPGVGRAMPPAAIASLIGVAALAGFPLTAGFPGRWALQTGLALQVPNAAIWLVLSAGIVLVAALRWAGRWFSSDRSSPRRSFSIAERLTIGLLVSASLLLGAFPQLASAWVMPALRGFANLSP